MPQAHPWHDVSPGENAPEIVNAIIENPKDSTLKYELDKETGLLKLDRYLFSAVHFPGDYGFIPQTLWEDNDPLDIFVITHRPTQPLALCSVKVIGILHMDDGGESDDKILAVYHADPRYAHWGSLDNVPPHMLLELRHFFETYKKLEGKNVQVYEFRGAKEAQKAITKAMEFYKTTHGARLVKVER